MDSLTHIILGAAAGEVVAGKKLGNRAMLWGAIGCTVPDFDVFATFFTDEMTATSFHRGVMHSFLFVAVAPWLLAKMTEWFYQKGHYRKQYYKAAAMIVWLLLYVGAAVGINFIPVVMGEGLNWYVFVPSLLFGAWLGRSLWLNYWKRDLSLVAAPYRTWVALFFWTILIHPLLDCFTNWGTQVWQPFSDYRMQWNTMAVADPLATLPFALCLVIAIWWAKNARKRALWNVMGLIWFCSYIALSVWHKSMADSLFEQTLQAKDIRYHRFLTNPSILNNVAWYGVAEGDTAYYYGMYGFNDREQRFKPISVLPKNHELLDRVPSDSRAGYFLRWFTNGYYNVLPYHGDTLQVNDLRFGMLGDTLQDNNYVFPFLVFKNAQGEWDVKQNNKNRSSAKITGRSFGQLWRRVKGI